jgi:hypothetical protein
MEDSMFEVHGLHKITLKFEMVASGLSKQELDRLLVEEADNYYNLRITRIRIGR